MSRGININNCGSAFNCYGGFLDENLVQKSKSTFLPEQEQAEIEQEIEQEIQVELKLSYKTKLKNKFSKLKAKIIDLFTKKPKKMECPIQLKMTRNYITLQCNHIIGIKPFLNLIKNTKGICPMCRASIKSWQSNRRLGVSENYILKDTKKLIVYKKTDKKEYNFNPQKEYTTFNLLKEYNFNPQKYRDNNTYVASDKITYG